MPFLHSAFLAQVLLLAVILTVQAAHDNYPVRSINIESADAVDYYETFDLNNVFGYFADPHAVHGSPTSDGGSVLCGKANSNSGGGVIAFVVKLRQDGTFEWGWRSTTASACNAVIEVAGGDVLAVGYEISNNRAQRSLTKLSSSTGSIQWTVRMGSSNSQKPHGAWEMAEINGNQLILSGLTNSADINEFWFKSYGNVVDGQAIVQTYDVTQLSATLQESDALFTYVNQNGFFTCKSAKSANDGTTIALMFSEEVTAALVLLDSNGTPIWGPQAYSNFEGTDVAVATDGSGFVVTGHGGDTDGIAGKLLKASAATGSVEWIQDYRSVPSSGAGSNYEYVYTECWGVTALPDGGYALSCGTGLEECSVLPTSSLRQSCNQGNAILLDTRAGAIARPVEIWQSMIVRTNAQGQVVWQRVDQYSPNGNTLNEYHSSAAEWIFLSKDGSLVAVNDEGTGIGLLKLESSGGTASPVTPSPTNAPTSAAPITPSPTPVPTLAPITSNPTVAPTLGPTFAPVTPAPTNPPTTVAPIPTSSPTNLPTTVAPVTPSPTNPPTPTPTSSPIDITTCVDSPFPMIHGRKEKQRYCSSAWMDKRLEQRCANAEIASHCPQTCNECETQGCEDSQKTFVVEGEWYHCDDACDDPEYYCSFEGVPETCRRVCGYCNNREYDSNCGF